MTAETVDMRTGEIIDESPPPTNPRDLPEPVTLEQANQQLQQLKDWLSGNSRARMEKLKELRPVQDRYNAVYNAALLASNRSEAALRKAEAEQATTVAHMPDDDVPLSERLSTLKLELKVLDTLGHDVRAVMSSIQSVSANLRAELAALGSMPS